MAKSETDNPFVPKRPLRLLIVEDNPPDAELMVAILKRAGYALMFDVLDSPKLLQQRLAEADYDVILSDHNLRNWTGMDALEILQKSQKDIPFIVVTATLGDEAAVEYVKQGATDYLLKHRLERLPVALGNALRDKTQREQAARLQEEILSAKREWELTFDAVSDSVFLLDEQGCIRRANRAAAEVLGLAFSQLIGQPCYKVIHGLDEPRPECPHCLLQKTGQEEHGDFEEPRLGKFFNATATPLRDPTGALRGCVFVMRDITERKRAEAALLERTTYLDALMENSPLAIVAQDSHGLVRMCNPAFERLFLYGQAEIVGTKLDEFITTPEQVSEAMEFTRRVLAGESLHATISRRRKDGTLVDVDIYAVPLTVQGELVGAYGLYQDITERRRLEEQLRQAQKMEAIGRLAGGIAHDFNNLLNVIMGYSELVLDLLGPSDQLRKKVEEIYKAGERATALTRQLLAFGRRQVLEPTVLDLNALVANAEKLLQRLIGEDIELVSLLNPELGRVKADGGRMEQVIMNLAINARDAMPQGGKLTLETANVELDEAYARAHTSVAPGRYVMLAVSDTGCGMDEETQSHIFEPFFTTKEQDKGSGLGLATVYGIVKQSGGNIWIYSEPGRGTAFKIYLPRVEEAVEAPVRGEAMAGPPQGSETILLVEDEGSVRGLVRESLERHGYTVLEAKDGAEAMLLCTQHKGPIHMLLTDVVMPGMSGRELTQRLRPLRPGTKVLYMSGYTDNAIVHHGVLEPGTAFLQKPFRPVDLARKVREVLDASKGP